MWCVGFREVSWVQPERIGKGPLLPRVRVTIEHGRACIQQVLRERPRIYLPEGRGAGPCGTWISAPPTRGALAAWSMQHLITPLAQWYAARNVARNPLSRAGAKCGAKSGGGHGRAALW